MVTTVSQFRQPSICDWNSTVTTAALVLNLDTNFSRHL
jgi:hypothetical protein